MIFPDKFSGFSCGFLRKICSPPKRCEFQARQKYQQKICEKTANLARFVPFSLSLLLPPDLQDQETPPPVGARNRYHLSNWRTSPGSSSAFSNLYSFFLILGAFRRGRPNFADKNFVGTQTSPENKVFEKFFISGGLPSQGLVSFLKPRRPRHVNNFRPHIQTIFLSSGEFFFCSFFFVSSS